MTVDGTDFPIKEPQPFSSKWCSHKHKRAGLRCEVGVCIQTGDIVWAYGPFAAGRWSDLKIFRCKLKGLLLANELVEADGTCRDPKCRIAQDRYVSGTDRRARGKARARHETINKFFKQFGSMKQFFRHPLHKHKVCFNATVVLVQLAIRRGELAPFQVCY